MTFDFEISVPGFNPTFEITLPIVISEEGSCPVITEIDGGDFSGDSQFGSINGLLDGGSL